LHVGENDRVDTNGRLETDCQNNIELLGEMLTARCHEVEGVSEGHVVEDDVADHRAHHENTREDFKPVVLPLYDRRLATQNNLRSILEGREVAAVAHHQVKRKNDSYRPGNDCHESSLDRVLKLGVDWQHIALVGEGEHNNARSREEL
jgi:hypothetical protein